MKIIGHRGAAGLALENTLESISAALTLPIYAVEFDIRCTKDKELILLHDPHTERVAGEKVNAHDVTLSELQKISLNNNQYVPTLKQALKLVGNKKPVVLDIKETGLASELVRALKDFPDTEVSLTGRHEMEMRKVFNRRPDIPFFIQGHFSPFDVIQTARRIQAKGISLNMWLMNPLTYQLAKRYNLEVRLYTVNHPWLVKFLQYLYPEIVIYTNYPHKYIKKYGIKRKAAQKHES